MFTGRIKAPDFSAPSSRGDTISLSQYSGRHLVLYFYPKSFTYGCTRETVRFRDASAELRALGAEVIGVSPDTLDVQCRFASHYQAEFPILADPDRKIASAFRALYPFTSRVRRTTFIVDPEGFIVARFHHALRYEKHVDDAIAFLKRVRRQH
ncbi:MAG: peroxiredoxin [Polyangiales bacterium]